MNLVVRSIAQIVEILVTEILTAVIKILLCCLMPGVWLAQTSATKPKLTAFWGYGLEVGNGLALHLGYFSPHLVALGRVWEKWWHAPNETGDDLFGNPDVHAQQI